MTETMLYNIEVTPAQLPDLFLCLFRRVPAVRSASRLTSGQIGKWLVECEEHFARDSGNKESYFTRQRVEMKVTISPCEDFI